MSMTKEQRLEAARAKVARLREVAQTRGRGADRMDWKPKAKIYLHPGSELHDRLRVWFPRELAEKDDKGKETGKKKVMSLPYNVPKDPKACPFQTLRSILSEREDIDPDEVILAVGSGRGKTEFSKGEILGLDGYDYRRSLKPNADFVTAAIKVGDGKGKRPEKLKVEVLSGAKTLAVEIRKEIDSEMDESGEEAGNPYFTPYPFIIEFHDAERGTDMYSARARVQESPGDDEELNALLEGDAPDLEDELKLSDPDEMMSALTAALIRDDIEVVIENADEVFKKPAGKTGKKATPAPRTKKVEEEPEEPPADEELPGDEVMEEPEEEPAAEEPEPEPEPEPAPKPAEKPAVKEPERKPAPTAKREKKAAEPANELGWKPGPDEPYDICPKCHEAVPQTAEKCPHPNCGAKYVTNPDEAF
jgi:hypothetical protein